METPTVFDNLGLTSAYIMLHGDKYSSEEVFSDFAKNDYVKLYKMSDNFKKIFYRYDKFVGGSQVNFSAFK